MMVMTQVVPAQNESCAAASAYPPAPGTPMFRMLLSDERRTWYNDPSYAAEIARVVLNATTHGVPPAA
jgi:hypothetical protein